jgi:DNA-binding transcriptional regulator/RsmH inhibitor MraZ
MSGSSTARIDARGWVRIPQPYRSILSRFGTSCYLVLLPSPSAGLGIFPLATWQEVASGRRSAGSLSSALRGECGRIDRHGWIAIPREFLVSTHLTEHVAVLGCGDYLTICNPEAVEAQPIADERGGVGARERIEPADALRETSGR